MGAFVKELNSIFKKTRLVCCLFGVTFCKIIFKTHVLPKPLLEFISDFNLKVCDQCDNFRFEEMEFNFGFEVSPGMEAGQEFLYVGAGEVITDGEPGDLRVKIL